eukprot:2334730-Lingulodinium_polyedra.AAC.1
MGTGAIQTWTLTQSKTPKRHGHGRNQTGSKQMAILSETLAPNCLNKNGKRDPRSAKYGQYRIEDVQA